MIQVTKTNLQFEREPLAAPFGFKGGFVSEIWQVIATLESGDKRGVGLGVQGVLWSDPQVFAANAEASGNCLMLAMTAFALRAAQEIPFETPLDLLDKLFPLTLDYGRQITRRPNLRRTFALNALVPVDFAAWRLYAAEKGITRFEDLIPAAVRPAMAYRHEAVASVPAIGYGMTTEEVVKVVDEGYCVLKIKIGSDPDRDGDPEKMVAWDTQRLLALHAALKDRELPHSETGRVQYYLDANGRYDSKERVLRLLAAVEKAGVLERTVLLEEPFPEENHEAVGDIPLRVVADESAHTDLETRERIGLGYGAIALKPIAKTLSMSFKMALAAHALGVPYFCADLTVNPTMVDWNKLFTAHLPPLPDRKTGLLEANGHQNYKHWKTLQTYHPCYPAPWIEAQQGLFRLDADFYARSGGFFLPSAHYDTLV